jgi:hypothetical protein
VSASPLELQGYVEQAEVWQARAARAEARAAELEAENVALRQLLLASRGVGGTHREPDQPDDPRSFLWTVLLSAGGLWFLGKAAGAW